MGRACGSPLRRAAGSPNDFEEIRDDPQFRRNRERIVRDAERELITIEWDLGYAEDDS
jgi:hypothetical protein